MNVTTVEKTEKGRITTWFQCSRCPIETDRGYKVRICGVTELLCRGCYQDQIENRCIGKRGAAAAGRRGR